MLEWADGDGDEGDVDRCNEWDDLDAERVRWGAAVAAGLRRALLPARSEQPGDSNGGDLVCGFLPRPQDAPGVVTAMTFSFCVWGGLKAFGSPILLLPPDLHACPLGRSR